MAKKITVDYDRDRRVKVEPERRIDNSFMKDRTLAHIAGRNHYIDKNGRMWGIKTFSLKQLDYFNNLLTNAITLTGSGNDKIKKLTWVEFVRHCLTCHTSHPGLKITIRRMLGLTDYSRRDVKHLVKHIVPEIADAITRANLEKTIVEILNTDTKEVNKESAKWGEVISGCMINLHIMPDEYLDLTMPQLKSLEEYGKDEETKNHLKQVNEMAAARAAQMGNL